MVEPGQVETDKVVYIRERNNAIAETNAIAEAIEKAKAKNARLRLMRERNENYLAERAEEGDDDEL